MDAGGKKEARMKNILLIVTGCPGSGKTSFSSKLCAHYPALSLVSYDAVKEEFCGAAEPVAPQRKNS